MLIALLLLAVWPPNQVVEAVDGRVLAALLKARYAMAHGDFSQAMSFADEAVSLAPQNPEAAYAKIEAMLELHESRLLNGVRQKRALIHELKRFVARFPDDYRFPKALGGLLVSDAKWVSLEGLAEPDAYLEQALRLMGDPGAGLDEDRSDVHFQLGRWYMGSERYYEASRSFENVCRIEPELSWAWYYAAQTAEAAHRLPTALAAYRRFQEIRKKERRGGLPVRLTIAYLEAVLEPGEAKMTALKAMLRASDTADNTIQSFAYKFSRAGLWGQAIELLRMTPEASQTVIYFRRLLDALMRMGRYEEALSEAKRALGAGLDSSSGPMLDAFLVNYAIDAAVLADKHDEAVGLADRYGHLREIEFKLSLFAAFAAYLDSGSDVKWLALMEQFADESFIAELRQDVAKYGLKTAALRNVIQTEMRWEAWGSALRRLDAALDAGAPRAALLEDEATVCALLGLYERSFRAFEGLMAREPDRVDIWNNYGYFLTISGVDLDKAKPLLERALKAEPENGAFHDSMGWLLYKSGAYIQAERHMARALSIDGKNGEKLEHMGDVLFAQGRVEEARRYWSEAMEYAGARYFDVLKKLDPEP